MAAASKRKARDEEKPSGGLPITARFALSMALALTLVMSAAGFLLYQSAARVSRNVQETTLVDAVSWTAPSLFQDFERVKVRAEREVYYALQDRVQRDMAQTARDFPEGSATRNALQGYQSALRDEIKGSREERERKLVELGSAPIRAAASANGVVRGVVDAPGDVPVHFYRMDGRDGLPDFKLYLPDSASSSEQSLLGLVLGATLAVILAGAIVSVWVANQVARPISEIVEDIRHISTGDLAHRTRAKAAGGEIGTLARAIDRMTNSLAAARENEVELQVRQREVEVAAEVREQLLPQTTPTLPGYDIGALHIGAAELGGDFHDFVEIGPQGRDGVGLLVCEVSGRGTPGAIVGATARSYLHARLSAGGDVKQSMQEVNRQLARDVRRGMAVTSLYALIDGAQGIATVACPGHKVPLIRYTAADKKVRLIHPEGIALGFDKGPVFDGKLEVTKVPIEPGDRLVLVNSGAVTVQTPEGAELGEKALYGLLMRLGGLPTHQFLAKLRAAIEQHAGGVAPARDVSVLTIARG